MRKERKLVLVKVSYRGVLTSFQYHSHEAFEPKPGELFDEGTLRVLGYFGYNVNTKTVNNDWRYMYVVDLNHPFPKEDMMAGVVKEIKLKEYIGKL